MRSSNFIAYGALNGVYADCKVGEGLPWHGHGPDITHGHIVIQGATKVEIEGEEPRKMTPADSYLEFPKGKQHQITALEDGTIFINPISADVAAGAYRDPITGQMVAPPRTKNRVLMADGTIVETD